MAIQREIETKIGVCPVGRHNRVNIRPLIDKIQEEGYDPYLEYDRRRSPVGPSYLYVPDQRKIDLYTMTAIIVPRVIDLALQERIERPPFGLLTLDGMDENRHHRYKTVESFVTTKPFFELDHYMLTTLVITLHQVVRGGRVVDDPKLQSIYDAYNDIAFLQETIPSDLISRGVHTASHVMSHILEVIPKVYQRQYKDAPYNPDDLSKVASNSFPVIALLAAGHKDIIVPLIEILQNENGERVRRDVPFNPDYFIIKENFRLDFSDEFKTKIKKQFGAWTTEFASNTPTVGCPALYSDAVKKLWNWYLEIAEVIYRGKEQIIVALKETEPSSRD